MSQTTSTTTCIEDLPWEMISELFKNLPPEDLVACSMVNKRWHSVYSNIKLHSLVVTNYGDTFRWYYSNRPIKEAERCGLSMFLRLLEKPLLSNFNHLVLSGSFEFVLNDLNQFQQLVHLEIGVASPVEKVHLTLPRLKVLAIHYWDPRCSLTIDAPQLSTLLYEDVGPWEVKHPETIRMLETEMVDAKLATFKSVDCLVIRQFKAINKSILLTLPKLRELRYDRDIEFVFDVEYRREAGTSHRIKRTLNDFLDEAKRLRGSDFRFTFAGLQLTNVNVDKIDFEVQVHKKTRTEYVHNEYVYMKNYHLIEPDALHYIRKVDYTDLLGHATGGLPCCFSKKFTGIEDVYATDEVQNPDHFLRFLESLGFLRKLILENTGLGQEFFDQLPASARSLISLTLRDEHCEDELQLNFDFIGRLSSLSWLDIRPVLSFESLTSLVRSLGRWKEAQFYFQSREERFKIELAHLTNWRIEKAGESRSLFETENPNEILSFFGRFQADNLR